jgi:DNA-binding HxlR family transcriptional regulator
MQLYFYGSQMTDFADMNCSLARSLAQVGERWSLLIIREAIMGTSRFDDFQKRLEIARNILATRLAELVQNGILSRNTSSESKRIFDYALTEKGWELYTPVVALLQWGDKWLDKGKGAPVALFDRRTNKPIARLQLQGGKHNKITSTSIVILASVGADERTRRRFSGASKHQA